MQKNQTNPVRVALVTGAARRIGAEVLRGLHATGMHVVLHYHQSGAEATALCADLNAQRASSAVAIQADLSDTAGRAALIQQATQAWGRLDVLVNNASRFYRTPWGEVTELAWEDLQNSNLKAPFFLSQLAAPYLAKQQGCIVNITDIHGERPMRDYAAYCISKAGLLMMTKVLAKELAPAVRVNAVSPGAIAWPEGENTMTDVEKQKVMQRIALQKAGSAQEIAKAVLFFVEAADYVTGQILAVDGGRSLMI